MVANKEDKQPLSVSVTNSLNAGKFDSLPVFYVLNNSSSIKVC